MLRQLPIDQEEDQSGVDELDYPHLPSWCCKTIRHCMFAFESRQFSQEHTQYSIQDCNGKGQAIDGSEGKMKLLKPLCTWCLPIREFYGSNFVELHLKFLQAVAVHRSFLLEFWFQEVVVCNCLGVFKITTFAWWGHVLCMMLVFKHVDYQCKSTDNEDDRQEPNACRSRASFDFALA